jgi:hypothetical protein
MLQNLYTTTGTLGFVEQGNNNMGVVAWESASSTSSSTSRTEKLRHHDSAITGDEAGPPRPTLTSSSTAAIIAIEEPFLEEDEDEEGDNEDSSMPLSPASPNIDKHNVTTMIEMFRGDKGGDCYDETEGTPESAPSPLGPLSLSLGTNHCNLRQQQHQSSSSSNNNSSSVSCLLEVRDLLVLEEPLKDAIAAGGDPAATSTVAMEQDCQHPEGGQEDDKANEDDADKIEDGDNDNAPPAGCFLSFTDAELSPCPAPPAKRRKQAPAVVHCWSSATQQSPELSAPSPRSTTTVIDQQQQQEQQQQEQQQQTPIDNSNKNKRRGIVFNETVRVVPIPLRTEYSARVRDRIWSNTNEIQENAVRNTIEFASEGWDWRAVLLDEAMHLCSTTGALIHPIHYEPHDPAAGAVQQQQQQCDHDDVDEANNDDVDDGAATDGGATSIPSCIDNMAMTGSSEETTTATITTTATTTTTTMTFCSQADE